MSKKITIELIEGEIPKEPVDVTKALKSEPAFPVAEAKIEAYHHHGGGGALVGGIVGGIIGGMIAGGMAPPPQQLIRITARCPFCGGVVNTSIQPGQDLICCYFCHNTFRI